MRRRRSRLSVWPRRDVKHVAALAVAVAALSACTDPAGVRQPIPVTPSKDIANAPVVRRDVPPPSPPPSGAAAPPTAIVIPPGVQYVCVVDQDGQRRQTSIAFSDKVAALCSKHPEMGPCQYERDMCRRSGGRVFTANNVEITLATEAEYDKKVLRVRFKAN
jgi:hypothetical protein